MSATQGVCIDQPPNLPTNKNAKGTKFIEDMVKQHKDSIVLLYLKNYLTNLIGFSFTIEMKKNYTLSYQDPTP